MKSERVKKYKLETPKTDIKLEVDFLEAWSMYPRREGKVVAQRHYNRLREKYTKDAILKAVIEYAQEKLGTEKQYLKQGSTFFGERIYDYLDKTQEQPLPIEASAVASKPKARCGSDIYTEYLNHMYALKYNDYLLTEHWKHFIKEAIKHYRYKCTLCNAKDVVLHVHHKTYENLARETFNDVIVLCADCHKMVHKI
jgi:hypothetical protein